MYVEPTPVLKDPDEDFDVGFDWTQELAGDTIANSTWPGPPAGVTLHGATNDTTTTTVYVSGGTHGQPYTLVNRIVTAGGRTLEAALTINVRSTN